MVTASELLEAHRLGRICVYDCANGLSDAEAAWKPAEHARSIQEMIVHIGGAERFWLGQLGHESLGFPDETTLEAALAFARGMENKLNELISSTSVETFNQNVSTERGDLSLAWMIKRVTQHMFYHLGTLVYLRAIQQPDWGGEAGFKHWQMAVDHFSALVKTDS